jgi:hypothetical protein
VDVRRWPHRRRIERLEAGFEVLLTRLSQVESEQQNATASGAAIEPFDRIIEEKRQTRYAGSTS